MILVITNYCITANHMHKQEDIHYSITPSSYNSTTPPHHHPSSQHPITPAQHHLTNFTSLYHTLYHSTTSSPHLPTTIHTTHLPQNHPITTPHPCNITHFIIPPTTTQPHHSNCPAPDRKLVVFSPPLTAAPHIT